MDFKFKMVSSDKAQLKAYLSAQSDCPEPLRFALHELLDGLMLPSKNTTRVIDRDEPNNAIYLEADGIYDPDTGSGHGRFECRSVYLKPKE